jgi:hypothetical protein
MAAVSALPKPHRIAVLVPEVTIDGPDAAYEREAAILVWTACLEVCGGHPRLSVLDADATPLLPQDGHFAPQNADRGARPGDAFFGPTRRDELIWLELTLGKAGMVRLHAIGRDGRQESFDALGRNLGEQIQQVLGAWLSARKLGVLPRPFDSVSSEDVLAVVRVIAPTLAEQARAWSLPVASGPTWSLSILDGTDEDGPNASVPEGDLDDNTPVVETAIEGELDLTVDTARSSIARPLIARLPAAFRIPALRLLELALREELGAYLREADPARARSERRPSVASALEQVAVTSMAALRRPANLEVLEAAAAALAETGRLDEARRLLERSVALHDDHPRAHLALLDLDENGDRVGAWLERALRSSARHGCPMDPVLPWYPDQIDIDLRASSALLHAGRLREAIALRANRLEGRGAGWPAQVRVLEQWRADPRLVAWCYAREGYFRGDEARAVEGFARIEPENSIDLAILLESLVVLGREDHAPLAWARHGLGRGSLGVTARLAAAHALMAAGEWRRGIEQLWRAELGHPERDDQVAIGRLGLVMSAAPIEVIETALGERIAIGAPTLARRMARDAADFVPLAAKSGLVARALGKPTFVEPDPAWLAGFSEATRSRRAIDGLFAELGPLRKEPPSGFDISDELQRGDRLVNRWLEVAFTEASEEDRAALAQAAAYTAAQATTRYLAATTQLPSTVAGALRIVAGEALALVRRHRTALGDRDARALLGALDPLLRRVDRWIGATWLAAIERAVGVDERSGGEVAAFARDYPVVAARILGPEETAVLSWSVAQLHRERPDGWASKVAAQASRLATHTGFAGTDEWADAIAAQLAGHELELEDAIDALHTACFLAEDRSAVPCVHAARTLLEAGRSAAALAVLCGGLRAAEPKWRDHQLAALENAWNAASLDVPFELQPALAGLDEALRRQDAVRAERLGRWVVARDPEHPGAHRKLGLALAHQGKVLDALPHLVRGAGDEAMSALAGALVKGGRTTEAIGVLDHASFGYARSEQWLAYAELAAAAGDEARAARARELARQLEADPSAPVTTAAISRRDQVYEQLEAGDHCGAAAQLTSASWRVRRAALHAARFRSPAENHVEVTPHALAAAVAVLADTVGMMDVHALLARTLALRIREQAYFARDPVPRLGERMTREAFHRDARMRGTEPIADHAPEAADFVDRVVVPGSKVARTSDYVALLRDLAALHPRDALAQFDLDDSGYLEVARAWAAAMARDPSIAKTIEAGLARGPT